MSRVRAAMTRTLSEGLTLYATEDLASRFNKRPCFLKDRRTRVPGTVASMLQNQVTPQKTMVQYYYLAPSMAS